MRIRKLGGRSRCCARHLGRLPPTRKSPSPPPQLAERTLAKIAEHICAEGRGSELPKAPPISPQTISGGRSWWRRADVMVAASLMITAVGIALVVLGRMRGPTAAGTILECKNNLREFFVSLQEYRDVNGRFPDVAKESPRDVAGMVVPILNEAGTLSESVSIRCPGIGPALSCPFTVSALSKLSDAEFAHALAIVVDVLRLFARLSRGRDDPRTG